MLDSKIFRASGQIPPEVFGIPLRDVADRLEFPEELDPLITRRFQVLQGVGLGVAAIGNVGVDERRQRRVPLLPVTSPTPTANGHGQ